MNFLKADAQTKALFDLSRTHAAALLEKCLYPWQALDRIGEFILSLGQTLSLEEYLHPQDDVWIAKDVLIAPTASVSGPAVICSGAQLRHGAFIRGNVIAGRNAVIGNSTELKNCILFDGVQVPHFNYVGDSILGFRAHMGAGAIISNVKSDKTFPLIRCTDGAIAPQLKKCGAFLGDFTEIGCGCVLNPGTVIGRNSSVYPLSSVRGSIPKDCIFKSADRIVPKTD